MLLRPPQARTTNTKVVFRPLYALEVVRVRSTTSPQRELAPPRQAERESRPLFGACTTPTPMPRPPKRLLQQRKTEICSTPSSSLSILKTFHKEYKGSEKQYCYTYGCNYLPRVAHNLQHTAFGRVTHQIYILAKVY